MSSEPEENADHVSESNAQPSVNEGDVPSISKENALNEQAKPKKRRRGKKRKHRKESTATCESENLEESDRENHDSPPWDSDEDLSCDVNSFTDVIIRPINVPKAPENSTQFIMDDHNECRLYMSFETPNPYLADPPRLREEDGDIVEPEGEDAAYRDIDYEYESPQDFDNSAYYDREFEQSYKSNRFDELMRLPRAELIGMLHSLESRSKELNDDLVKENPSPMLDKLQHELLELQEKHNVLQEHNSKLTALVMRHSDSAPASVSRGESSGGYGNPRSSFSSESYSPVYEPYYTFPEPIAHQIRAVLGSPAVSPFGEKPASPDSGPFGERLASTDSSLVGGRSETTRSPPCREEGGIFAGKSRSPHSVQLDGDSNSHGVSYGDDRPEPDVYIETRLTNNVDGVILNVAFQDKCSSVVMREEELPASETSVV